MSTVKGVVWDLDGTVWPGVAIESPTGSLPDAYPEALAAMTLLESRGIVNSVASRTSPSMRAALLAHPQLRDRFVAPQLSWSDKGRAIETIADELGLAPGDLAFVDDNPFEREQVAAMLPEVRVLAPTDLYDRLDDPDFRPARLTADGGRRVDRYRDDERRKAAARDFSGPRADFLRSLDMRLEVAPAGPADVDRIAEQIERTHRFNSTAAPWTVDEIRSVVADPHWIAAVARLNDRFGEHGSIATVLIECGPDDRFRALRMLAVSCRVAGREIPETLLGWALRAARDAGVADLVVDVRPNPANLELRVLLRRLGFEAMDGGGPTPDGLVALRRATTGEGYPVPAHITLVEAATSFRGAARA